MGPGFESQRDHAKKPDEISSGFLFFKPDASGCWDHEGMCGMDAGTSNPSGITTSASGSISEAFFIFF
jgi:hypothetical protein